MRELELEVHDWLGPADGPAEEATLASLGILVGPAREAVTEVEDIISRSVRRHINVPVDLVASWLLANWWRLRWEPRRDPVESPQWRHAHCLAALGGGYAWPALEIASDGERMQLTSPRERTADASGIRYLRRIDAEIPARDFESAVDAFAEQVESRLASSSSTNEVSVLRAELQEERTDPERARQCKLQALAGIDPGDAGEEWLAEADALTEEAGPAATDEIMAVLPKIEHGLQGARDTIEAIRAAPGCVDLEWAHQLPAFPGRHALPWQRGEALARALRAHVGLPDGRIDQQQLGDLLKVKLPLAATGPRKWSLGGAFSNGSGLAQTRVQIPSRREEAQRFFLSRVIGCVAATKAPQHLWPVTSTGTALQKLERAFAQEFLCPWASLDAFTDEHGTDDEGVADAADHYLVDRRLVLSTLVNKGKVSRHRLEESP